MTTSNITVLRVGITKMAHFFRSIQRASSNTDDAWTVRTPAQRANRLILYCLLAVVFILSFVRSVDVNRQKAWSEGYMLGYQAVNAQFVKREYK